MIQIGSEFDIGVNHKVVARGGKLEVIFVSVSEDSRCPEGVECVWSGNAKIKIKLNKSKIKPATIELNTDAGSKSASYLNFEVRLISLTPRPKQNETISPRDYKARLVIIPKPGAK